MPHTHLFNVKVIHHRGFYMTSRKEADIMLRNGEAERVNGNPRIIRLLETPVFDEELKYLRGRIIPGATRGGSGAQRARRKGWKVRFHSGHTENQRGNSFNSGETRCRPPRARLSKAEQDFQQYKRNYLTRHGEEGRQTAENVMAARIAGRRTR